jgi:putative polyhydroxyalkanoate system protein
MADISLSHAHGLSFDDAKSKTDQIVQHVQTEFPSLVNSISWNNEKTVADLKGKGFTGTFRVDPTNVGIDIELGMLTRPFKGKIEEKIRGQIAKFFPK